MERTIKTTTWKEYLDNLNLTHWRWYCEPWNDPREPVLMNYYPALAYWRDSLLPWRGRIHIDLGNGLYIIPVYPSDIYQDPLAKIVPLGINLIVISWDNFSFDIHFIEECKDDWDNKTESWVVIERKNENYYQVVSRVSTRLEKLVKLVKKQKL